MESLVDVERNANDCGCLYSHGPLLSCIDGVCTQKDQLYINFPPLMVGYLSSYISLPYSLTQTDLYCCCCAALLSQLKLFIMPIHLFLNLNIFINQIHQVYSCDSASGTVPRDRVSHASPQEGKPTATPSFPARGLSELHTIRPFAPVSLFYTHAPETPCLYSVQLSYQICVFFGGGCHLTVLPLVLNPARAGRSPLDRADAPDTRSSVTAHSRRSSRALRS